MKQLEKNYQRIVIKLGSSFLCSADKLALSIFDDVARQVSLLAGQGKKVVVVSSGAIALGMRVLELKTRPKDLSSLQAAAAVGQHLLMGAYQASFKKYGFNCAQILLTYDDFADRKRYLNAKKTIATLLDWNTIPIVNENDTISSDEIKFGDNDKLSSLVATLVNADLLIMLSDVDGLLDKDKKVVRLVDNITPEIKALASSTKKQTSVGGMITKISAAKIATDSGIPCVIANGSKKNIIMSVIDDPQRSGTLFLPGKSLDAKKRWIAFGTKPKGKITVDDGAKRALINNKSLLSVGVVSVEGSFDPQEIVSVLDKQDNEVARGKSSVSSKQLDKVKGGHFEKEIIHRDNIVIL